MPFRVWDNQKQKWVMENIYSTPDGRLFKIWNSVLGWFKVPLELSEDRYIRHNYIELLDKDGNDIYEGDYVKAQVDEDKEIIGVVIYANELSAYVILCVDSDEYYPLGSDVSEYIEIIGNVFEGYKR